MFSLPLPLQKAKMGSGRLELKQSSGTKAEVGVK